jgi:hypothetical protein
MTCTTPVQPGSGSKARRFLGNVFVTIIQGFAPGDTIDLPNLALLAWRLCHLWRSSSPQQLGYWHRGCHLLRLTSRLIKLLNLMAGGRFLPGQSGNPGGRSTEKRFREALLLELAEDGDARKPLREVAKALIAAALTGDVSAIREIADRLDGKPAQAIDVTGDDRRIIVEVRSFPRPPSLGGPVIEATPADVVGEVAELPDFLKLENKQ